MSTTMTRKRGTPPDPLTNMAYGLAKKIEALAPPSMPPIRMEDLVGALHELLDGQDSEAKSLRTEMQIHLIKVSNAEGEWVAISTPVQEMLSTEEAAHMMGCSRPYVAMLIDAKKLAGGEKSKGGHRKVPKASIEQWIEQSKLAKHTDKDYKKAAADAGMYAVPEKEYLKASARKSVRAR